MNNKDLRKGLVISHAVVELFAKVSNSVIEKEQREDPDFKNVASSILAGAIQFAVKSFMIAGFSKEELMLAMSEAYENANDDPDVLRARALRKLIEETGTTTLQ